MPKIPSLTSPQVSTQVTPGARARPVHSGAGQLAGALSSAAGALAGPLAEYQREMDTTAAESALTDLQRRRNDIFFAPDTGYFHTQAQAAVDGAGPTREALAKARREIEERLKTPEARRAFSRAADTVITNALVDIDKHTANGINVAAKLSVEAKLENTLENAALYWSQPERLAEGRIIGEEAVLESLRLAGIRDSEITAERLQTFRSEYAAAAINSALQTSATEAQALFDRFGPEGENILEGPRAQELRGRLSSKRDAEKAILIAEAALAEGGESRQAVLAAVAREKDPTVRAAARSQAMTLFTQQKVAIAEAQSDALDTAAAEGLSAVEMENRYPDEWARLSKKQKAAVRSGAYVTTNWPVYFEILSKDREELLVFAATEGFSNAMAVLAPTERAAVRKLVGDAVTPGKPETNPAGRTRATETTARLLELMNETSVNDLGKGQREQLNALYEMVEVARQQAQEEKNGRALTNAEYREVLDGVVRETVVSRDLKLFKVSSSRDVSDLGAEELRAATRVLEESGLPVISSNLFLAHRVLQETESVEEAKAAFAREILRRREAELVGADPGE